MDQAPIDIYRIATDAKEWAWLAIILCGVSFVALCCAGIFDSSRIARLEHIEGIDHLGRTVRKDDPNKQIKTIQSQQNLMSQELYRMQRETRSHEITIKNLLLRIEILEEKHGAKTE
jgi:hypothetical protein